MPIARSTRDPLAVRRFESLIFLNISAEPMLDLRLVKFVPASFPCFFVAFAYAASVFLFFRLNQAKQLI
jgi:hypothetical protein